MNAALPHPFALPKSWRVPRRAALALLALGVVFGDIGTSPLYALKETFNAQHGLPLTRDNVLGILSLLFWSLNVVVTIKYVGVVLRADNRGEGGVVALLSLALSRLARGSRLYRATVVVGLVGAALFYGDAMITPAISVLSAVEGLEVVSPWFTKLVLPISLAILALLFMVQKRGTAAIGGWFGPVMLVWFAALAAAGISQIARDPGVLAALDPTHAVAMGIAHPAALFVMLAAIFLVVTGAEALYADMGHFGRGPVTTAWLAVALPALCLNYFGQGAAVLADPATLANPFYLMLPGWAQIPMVGLATAATVIASQAVISGAYSLTAEAIQLGYWPRLAIEHTSEDARGQIYMPAVNFALFVAVAGLAIGFGSSSRLASAYGIAVAGTMLVTTLLAVIVARLAWRWSWLRIALVLGALGAVDVVFFAANSAKIVEGGAVPLAVGAVCLALMLTWHRGRALVREVLQRDGVPLPEFVAALLRQGEPAARVPGVAIFLTGDAERVPHALLHNLKHNQVLHDEVVVMTILTRDVPRVPAGEQLVVTGLAPGVHQVVVHVGFKDEPDVTAFLMAARNRYGLAVDLDRASYFLSRETITGRRAGGMARWRQRLFVAMTRNATRASDYFGLPPNRVIELGSIVLI